MRPYFVETIQFNSGGVRLRFVETYPCLRMANTAFANSQLISGVIESRLYEACLKFDRLLDEYIKSK